MVTDHVPVCTQKTQTQVDDTTTPHTYTHVHTHTYTQTIYLTALRGPSAAALPTTTL